MVWHLSRMVYSIVAVGLGLCVSEGYAGEYEVSELGASSGHAYDVNNYGETIGFAQIGGDLPWQVLLWKGALVDVGVPDVSESTVVSASAINDYGDVVGNHSHSSSISLVGVPFVQHHETGYTPLVEDLAVIAFARDINDRQLVVGNYSVGDEPSQAYLWQADGQGAPLGSVAEGHAVAIAVNNADPAQIAGAAQMTVDGRSHAFVWTEGGTPRDLGEFQGWQTVATGINDHGHVVGWFGPSGLKADALQFRYIDPPSDDGRAFLWSEDQGEEPWIDLGTLATDNAGKSVAYAINNGGQVVGYAETDSGEFHAFLYTREAGMRDLNALIPSYSGWVLEVAHGINQYGQIAGWGTLNGIWRAFLLTPEGTFLPFDLALQHHYEPQYPRVDEPLTLIATIKNSGTEPAAVRVAHTLADELKLLSLPGNCTQDSQQVECDIGELLAGESAVMTIGLQSSYWGRWAAVSSIAEATTQGLTPRLAQETTSIPISRKEPEIESVYHIVDLGTDVATEDDRGPLVNHWGEVALGGRGGVIYSGGVVQSVDSSTTTNFNDLNDDGWFVGSNGFPVVWDQDEGQNVFLDGFAEGEGSEAFGVNNLGQIVGMAVNGSNVPEAFIASVDNGVQWLGALSGGISQARDINDDGWIVGSSSLETGEARAFLYGGEDDALVALNTLGGDESSALAINNAGVIVGQAQTTNGTWQAARWSEGEISGLGALLEGGESRALDINEAGIAVGEASGAGGASVAVRYVDGRVEDWNEKLSEGSPWQLDKASGINDLNEIVGIGRWVDDSTPRAFLSVPLSLPPLFATEQRLTPTPIDQVPASGTRYSVVIDGDTLVIGNPDDNQQGEKAGAVSIYRKANDEWVFREKLVAGDGVAEDEFGLAVALDGSRLVVGYNDGVYVFQGAGEIWVQSARLEGAELGVHSSGIALNGDTLAFGFIDSSNGGRGVMVYTFDGSGWGQSAVLDTFYIPSAIALQGEYMFVVDTDLVVYKLQDGSVIQQQGISSPLGSIRALAADGDMFVVWATYKTYYSNLGGVYVYKMRNGGWFQYAALRYLPGNAVTEFSGLSVAINGDTIAMGVPYEGDVGAIYIFQRHGNQWIEEAKLTASDPQLNQQLGWAVAMDEGLVVGSTTNRPDGAVYTYALNHSPDSANLELSMVANREAVGVGESVTYTLAVTNLSDAISATGIDISFVLPSELDFSDSSAGCDPEAGVITCRIDSVPVLDSRQVIITAKALSEGAATSQAWVSAYQHDPNSSNNEASLDTLIEPAPPPRIVQIAPADGAVVTLTPHDTLQLSFEVENFSLEPPAGRHVHWWLNGESQGNLYTNVIDISDLAVDDHTITLILAEADHSEVSEELVTSFTIERPPLAQCGHHGAEKRR